MTEREDPEEESTTLDVILAHEAVCTDKCTTYESDHPVKGKTYLSFDTEDLLALVAVILAVGALLVAIIVAIALAMGHINGERATAIILGCVGGSAIAGVSARVIPRKK
jgi:hypothetical protein